MDKPSSFSDILLSDGYYSNTTSRNYPIHQWEAKHEINYLSEKSLEEV